MKILFQFFQTSLDPHVMLSLATWNDVRALTGVIKIFFRRLPEPICDSESWKSLACLIPEDSDELDESSLVYTLQAIRAKLNKVRLSSTNPFVDFKYIFTKFLLF